jgi:transcriptional regulator with XRE-family HTH domain
MRSLRKTTVAVVREELGLGLQEFADLIGKSAATVSSLENGRLRLSEKTALEISKKTYVGLSWLMTGDPKVPPVDLKGKPWSSETYEKRWAVDKGMAQAMIAFHNVVLQAILSKQLRENPELASIVISRSERFLKDLQAEFGLDKKLIDEFYDQKGKGTMLVQAVDLLWDLKTASVAPSPSSARPKGERKSA